MNQDLRVNKTNFHMKRFALGLALTRDALFCIFYDSTVFDIFTNSAAGFESYPAKLFKEVWKLLAS